MSEPDRTFDIILPSAIGGAQPLPIITIDGERLPGVRCVAFRGGSEEVSIPGDNLVQNTVSRYIETTVYFSPEIGRLLFELFFPDGFNPSPLERFGVAKCVELAERIAFGAWAVRCAERLVRDA